MFIYLAIFSFNFTTFINSISSFVLVILSVIQFNCITSDNITKLFLFILFLLF